MHLQVRERDWVVVGATEEELLGLGYRSHGASFPVFLHPETAEEYAMARTERKTGPGYKGFKVSFDPGVTLEEDLIRRDLTINAMALGHEGQLIDPWGGLEDLRSRTLRAVSPAFVEDPLRVLRLARFAARFADQGFHVAPETLRLMGEIVEAGEMEELTRERIWQELKRALGESCPWVFFEVLRACGALARIMPQLEALFGRVEGRRERAPLDAGSNAMASVGFQDEGPQGELAKRRWAILGSCLGGDAETLSKHLGAPASWRRLAVLASRHVATAQAEIGEVGADALFDLWRDCDFLRHPEQLPQLMSAWRAGGRGEAERVWAYLPRIVEAATAVEVEPLVSQGLTGQCLGDALAARRRHAIAELLAKRNRQ